MSSSPQDDGANRSRNHVLATLPHEAWDALASELEPATLPAHKQLETRGHDIEWIYFLESGIASVIAESTHGHQVESGIIGRDSMTGLGVALGDAHCAQVIVIQIPGEGRRVRVDAFRRIMTEIPGLQERALLYARAFMIQAAHTALANGAGVLEQRLARWLLMLHDRVDGETLSITHDYIATMLSVRRPGVSVALKEIEEHGLIRVRRGQIEILDRAGLLDRAGGLYGQTESEYRRLVGWSTPRE